MIRLRKSLRVATLLALLAAISAFLIAGCEDKNGQISGAVDSEPVSYTHLTLPTN